MANNLQNYLLSQTTKPKTPSSIPQVVWWLLLGFIACIDLAQVIMDLFLIGLAVSRVLDITVGLGIFLTLLLGNYKFDWSDILILIASFLGEEIPIVDAAPFWTLDVWRFYKKDMLRKQQVDI